MAQKEPKGMIQNETINGKRKTTRTSRYWAGSFEDPSSTQDKGKLKKKKEEGAYKTKTLIWREGQKIKMGSEKTRGLSREVAKQK